MPLRVYVLRLRGWPISVIISIMLICDLRLHPEASRLSRRIGCWLLAVDSRARFQHP